MVSWTARRALRRHLNHGSMPPTRKSSAAASGRDSSYTISELAHEFALTTRAIRYYEDEGMLAPQRRGNSRVYGERERVRLKLILRGKRLGFSLSEIRELLDLYEVNHNERAQLAMFIELLGERRARLLQQKEDIGAVLAEIDGIERECRRRLKDELSRARVAARDESPSVASGDGTIGSLPRKPAAS
jgi:DNA-binding transcriptional MerR regulator